jgi:general secretion pathway protein H
LVTAVSRGFTLLELLVVLAVVSLLAGVTLPYLRFGGVDARTAAQDLSAELALARSRAMATRRPANLVIDAGARRFGLDGAFDHDLPRGIALTWTLPTGQVEGKRGAITFFPDGGSTGGRLVLSGRGRDAAIEIDWLAGSIRRG